MLSAWLGDGLPLLESAESKCQRVRQASEAASLGTKSVRSLIEVEFEGRMSPQQLSGEECDLLVVTVEGVRRSAGEWVAGSHPSVCTGGCNLEPWATVTLVAIEVDSKK